MSANKALPVVCYVLAIVGCGGEGPTPPPPEAGRGTIIVETSTSGTHLDDGFLVALDGRTVREIPIEGSVTFSDVEAGEHDVALGDLALNCPLTGEPTRSVEVPANGTVTVRFEVSCSYLVYVAQNSGALSVLESVNDSVVLSINLPGTSGADGVAVSPDGSRVFVTLRIAGRLIVLETERHTVIADIDFGGFARGVGVTPDGAHALVAAGRSVIFVDTETNTIERVTDVAQPPQIMTLLEFAFSPNGSRAYVTDFGAVDGPGRIWTLDVQSGSVLSSVAVGQAPHGVGVTPDGALLLVGDQNTDQVTVVVAAGLSIDRRITVDRGPHSVAISPDGSTAYVTNMFGRVGEEGGTVSVLDVATGATLGTVRVPQTPMRVALSPDGERLYVVQSGSQLGVIDTASLMLTKTVLVQSAVGVALPPF